MIWLLVVGWIACWVFAVRHWSEGLDEDVRLFMVILLLISAPVATLIFLPDIVPLHKLNPIVFRRRK